MAVILCMSLASCSSVQNTPETSSSNLAPTPQESLDAADGPGENAQDNTGGENGSEKDKVITVYYDTGEVVDLIHKFQELHPDFGYEIEIYTEYNFGDEYNDLVHDLVNERLGVIPDIYSVAREDICRFTKGSDCQYALPFEELGLDVDRPVKEAEINQYMIDACTNPDGKLVALGYQSTAGAFIYRRSIAKKVWGTDDPAVIASKIGPGWDKFLKAAARTQVQEAFYSYIIIMKSKAGLIRFQPNSAGMY